MSYKAFRRQLSGKTPLWKLRLRFYGFLLVVCFPIMWAMSGEASQLWAKKVESWASLFAGFFMATGFLALCGGLGVRFVFGQNRNFQAWLEGGGNPYYDLLYFFNT